MVGNTPALERRPAGFRSRPDAVGASAREDARTHEVGPFPASAQHVEKVTSKRARLAVQLASPKQATRAERARATLKGAAGPTITLNAVGDVTLGSIEKQRLPADPRQIFAHVARALGDADISFANAETVFADGALTSDKCPPSSTQCFAFRVPQTFAGALADAGIDVVSIANNHTGDFGPEGRAATRRALDAVGIAHSGPVGDIASWKVEGLSVGLIAFSFGPDVYRIQEIEAAKIEVARLAATHDLVVVSFHGGAEGLDATHVPHGEEIFLGENRGDLRRFAHAVVDAGADLVLGHGPHVLRGMERYHNRLIAYSLGNFTSYGNLSLRDALGISVVLKVTLDAQGELVSAQLAPIWIEAPGTPIPDASARGVRAVRELSEQDFGSPLFDDAGRYQRP